jgi:superfamily II DNA or RNA helicase
MKKAVILAENCNSYLRTNDNRVTLGLWKALRWRERGYFHSRLYKQKLWDGYIDFFKRENGRFLTGLLPEVELALQHWGVTYEIEDKRNLVEFAVPEVTKELVAEWMPAEDKRKTPYDYQIDLANQIIEHRRGVIQAPTSAGKTLIMMTILKALPPNTPTLILANKKSLVEQNYDEMKKWGFPNVGRLYDKYKEPSMFTCATVQSLHKIAKILPHIRALVVDEIHDMMSKVPKKFYNKLTNCSVRVAVSATPFKYGGQDKTQKYAVKGYFGPIMRTDSAGETGLLTTKGLQGRDILSGSKSIFYVVDQPKLLYEVYLDAVTKGIAENIHFHKIVTGLARTLKGRTLILVERLSHGDTLHSMIPGSLWVQGKDDLETRKYVISQLSKSNDNVIGIATQGIFNAGINVFIHNLINAAGGQADHQIVQRMGRGLRVAGDKDVLNYYDFLFKINEYLEGHSNKRIKILRKEGHDVEIREQLDFPI